MKQYTFMVRVLFACIVIFGSAQRTAAQASYFDITVANERFAFAYNQVPYDLIPVYPLITSPIGYQWEQSSTAVDGFTPIPGATGAVYTFSAPLTQTTYFRRKTFLTATIGFYSNALRIEVVSVNWENLNYVREHDVLVAGVTSWQAVDQLPIGDKLQTTVYLDGMGRPIQKVSKEMATPDPSQPNLWGDVVSFSRYDAFGRDAKKYLPYTTTVEGGKYKTAPLTVQPQYYSNVYNETSAFSETTYDNSPLNREANVKAPGTAWAAAAGHSIIYELNEVADNVQNFTIGYASGATPVSLGPYAAKSLYKNIYIDENGKKRIAYLNTEGQVVLEKTQIDDNPSAAHTGWICVYTVYDDFGFVRFRIQPEGVKYLDANGWSFAGINGQKVLDEWCFRYEYDEKGRVIRKKAPGADELRMIYDQRDRIVFTQDGNQRLKAPAEWTAYLYDELDRVTLSTLYYTTKSVADLQTDINNAATLSTLTIANPGAPLENLVVNNRQQSITVYNARNSIEFVSDGGGSFETFTNDEFVAEISPGAVSPSINVAVTAYKNPIPAADLNNAAVTTVLKYHFYDNYSFNTVKPFSENFDNLQAYSNADPIAASNRTIDMLTGTMVRVLGTSTFLSSTIYYDDKARPIQLLSDNIKNGNDATTWQYHFDGRVLSSSEKHTAANTAYAGFGILTKYLFDKTGRINGIQKKFGDNGFKSIVSLDYDDLGRLKKKYLSPGYTATGKNELESILYSYNLHGTITGLNKHYALKTPGQYDKWANFFGLYLGYDNHDGVFAASNLNGHVTGTIWTTQGDDAQRKYDFTYDNSGRLLNALYNEKEKPSDSWSNAKVDLGVSGRYGKIEYDLNGNLLYLLHKGVVPGSPTPVTVDDLQYAYGGIGNKLTKVTDANLTAINGKLGDFTDGTNPDDDYVHDKNGNVVLDLNKNAKDLNNTPGANGIRYNHMDKPEEIRISGKGTIKIVYDANGFRLQKIYTPESGGNAITTSYVNAFVYKGNDLQYINFEEGRVRVVETVSEANSYDYLSIDGNINMLDGKRGAFDYFIRDYQENVRMIITEETHHGANSCTMETSRAANEEPLFGQVDANGNPTASNEVAARFPVANIPGQGSGNGWQNNAIGNHVSRIGNLAASKIGPNALLKVMAGDQVSATTIYYYQNPVTNTSGGPTLITDLLFALTQAIAGSPVTSDLAKGAASNITSPLSTSSPFASVTNPHGSDASGNNPKAYLTVLFFDERFNFVSEGSAYLRVEQAGNGAPALVLANIKAPKNGYAYVYVGNQSDEMVYFDNLQVSLNRGRIIEENHYYAYGLRIAGISSRKLADPREGHTGNKNLFYDKELIDDADLDWYDYGFRYYDPQIGRFTQLDPLTDLYPELTPYQYAGNEPIANVDLDGLEPKSAINFYNKVKNGTNAIMSVSQAGKRAGQWFVSVGGYTKYFKTSFWARAGGWLRQAVSYVPVVGGVVDAVEAGIKGDWAGVAIGLGGAALDVVTGGAGTILRQGAKAVVKYMLKETAENYVTAELGVNPKQVGKSIKKGVNNPGVSAGSKESSIKFVSNGPPESIGKGKQKLLSQGRPDIRQEDLDHIIERHWFTSSAKDAGKFAENTTGKSLKEMINTAAAKGTFKPNTKNRPGTIAEYDFGRVIGTSSKGTPATRLRVVLRPDGSVVTAFPF